MSYGIDGFAFASESIVGKYFGAKNNALFKKSVRYSFYWGACLAIVYSALFYWCGTGIIGIFSSDVAVRELTYTKIPLITIMPLVAFACYIWDGIYIGITASRQMRDTMLLSVSLYLLIYHCFKSHNDEVIWYALLLFLLMRGVMQTLFWHTNSGIRDIKVSMH
jgi:MATE family multidrug resistance protein